jgi:hypothetical protein
MTGSAPCSARAASDHTAEQAKNAMNSRRFMFASIQATASYHVSQLSDLFCVTAKLAVDVREGSLAEVVNYPANVRSTSESRRKGRHQASPFRATSSHSPFLGLPALRYHSDGKLAQVCMFLRGAIP